jgi:GPH family glycoside/pentoside/hexuronide:cation symporter
MQSTRSIKAMGREATRMADRLGVLERLAYGLGGLVNNLLGAAIGMMAIVLNLGLGMNPAVVGTLMALPRLTDALTDPLMGYISDHTRSRWGRRRPYIFVGAISAGLVFALLWQLPAGHGERFYFWYFLVGSVIFYLAYTVYATPWVALGYELTPDYNERTRLMGVSNFLGQFAWVAVPWFYAFMENDRFFSDSVEGARTLAILVGAFTMGVGVIPAIFLRERMAGLAAVENRVEAKSFLAGMAENAVSFFQGFWVTIRFKPFQKLCGATFLVFNGYMLISAFTSYVIIYYIYGGDKDAGAQLMGWVGTASAIGTFTVIPLVTWLSTVVGKRGAFFIAIGISVVGYVLKWFCFNPEHPWLLLLATPLIAFGLGGLFTLMGSMVADVCDLDELETGHRREGMYGSIFWWVVKLGMALALALSGVALNLTGFDVELGGAQSEQTLFLMRLTDVAVPIVASLLAIWLVYGYTLTEERSREVRALLEARRGRV